MAEIINLRLARKAKRRAEAAREAVVARAKAGRGKAERTVTRLEAERAERLLDGAKRDRADD